MRHLWIHFSLDAENPPDTSFDFMLDPIARQVWERLALETLKNGASAPRALRHQCFAELVDTLGRFDMTGAPGPAASLREWFFGQTGTTPASYTRRFSAEAGCGRSAFRGGNPGRKIRRRPFGVSNALWRTSEPELLSSSSEMA